MESSIDPIETELHKCVSVEDVDFYFRLILARPVNNAEFADTLSRSGMSRLGLAKMLLRSHEFATLFKNIKANERSGEKIDDHKYRIPEDLQTADEEQRKILLIGSCLMFQWRHALVAACPDTTFELLPMNNASMLPTMGQRESQDYDFQILQVGLRSVLPESIYFNLSAHDGGAYEYAFAVACDLLDANIDAILKYNTEHGIISFFLGFAVPQQNPLGRFQGRYQLNNMVFFIEELNRYLYRKIDNRMNVFYVDFDQILSNYGRKYFQDDSITHYNHGSGLASLKMAGDETRIEPIVDIDEVYTPNVGKVVMAAYAECCGQMRALTQKASVKLVIFDLDDTLWRGVAAEAATIGSEQIEGWPLGILEAVTYLWRRGILVAIVSKNDESTALRIWDQLYGRIFPIGNFAVYRINWEPKPDNVADILKAVNLLPESVLFVDDNPVERAAVRMAFPKIRTMDAPLAAWRRILLWSPELQPLSITEEAAARTSMVQAQIEREHMRGTLDRAEFVRSLKVTVTTHIITRQDDRRYARAFELLNKTNQFNTTGKRWMPKELHELFDNSGYFLAIEVEDVFTNYGIAAILVVDKYKIEQFVMSCRIFGLGVEAKAVEIAVSHIRDIGYQEVQAIILPTDRNKLSQDIYLEVGFLNKGNGVWAATEEWGFASDMPRVRAI